MVSLVIIRSNGDYTNLLSDGVNTLFEFNNLLEIPVSILPKNKNKKATAGKFKILPKWNCDEGHAYNYADIDVIKFLQKLLY